MQFSALNKELSNSSSLLSPSGKRSKPTQEAQESACLQLYHKAMKHQQDAQFREAKHLYQEILESEVMDELCAPGRRLGVEGASVETVTQTSTITRLKYLIYKNLASIAKEQGDYSAAVDAYIEASSIDTGDVTMWCQLALASSLLGNLLLARKSWEQALCCNEHYWPALEGLCTVLFALKDFYACLHAISKGLKLEPNFPRGLSYLQVIFKECPEFFDFPFMELRLHLMKPSPPESQKYIDEAAEMSRRKRALLEVTVISDPIIPPKKLTYFTIFGLSNWLITLYRHCKENSKTESYFGVSIDLSAATDGSITSSSSAAKKPSSLNQSLASGVLINLPAPTATALSSGGESDTEGQQEASSSHAKIINGAHGSIVADTENVSVSAVIVNNTAGATSSSGGSGDEGGGGRAVSVGGRRETKRKLFDLPEEFAPKRRSSRMKSRKRDSPRQSCFEMLKKYIPSWMMMTELPDLVDFSPLIKSKVKTDNSSKSERLKLVGSMIESTPVMPDMDTVKRFLASQQNNCGVVDILFKFVKLMAVHYDHKWAGVTLPTVKVFLDLYELLHVHISYPSPFCTHQEAQNDSFKQMAMIALCFVELYVDCVLRKKSLASSKRLSSMNEASTNNYDSSQTHSSTFKECFVFIQQCAGLVGGSVNEQSIYSLRVHWCVAKWKDHQKDTDGVMKSLLRCKNIFESSEINEPVSTNSRLLVVCLPNCREDPIISLDHVLEKMEQLEQSLSFKKVHEQFESGDHTAVVDKLLPLMDQDAESASLTEFLIGVGHGSESPGLFLLLQSLLKLNRFHACFQSAVQAFLLLLQADSHEGTDLWAVAVREVVSIINSCLSQGTEELLTSCDANLLKQLATCVLKTMDVLNSLTQLHSMPTCLLWRIFYKLISSDWKLAAGSLLRDRSDTPPLCDAESLPAEPMEEEHRSSPQDAPSKYSQSSGDNSESHSLNSPIHVPRSQLTPSPVLGLLQPGGGGGGGRGLHVARSPAASSTHSSVCSVEESPPGLSPSLHFLREAHNYLGGLNWCCKDDGCFLLTTIDVLREELRMLTKHPQKQREMLMQELDQCYYCLFKYPSSVKKAKSNRINEHNAEQIKLTWDSSLMLIEYVHPSHLPSIDDAKSPQVTPELVTLYGRITNVIPEYGKVLEMSDLTDFIDGRLEALPDPHPFHQHSSVISDVYYLLADESLKCGDNQKAIRHYSSNLCYCPSWFDSWAGLALARSRMVTAKLNLRDIKAGTDKFVQKQLPPILKCFAKAVSLNNRHCYIIEKYGFFCYAAQSFASQIIHLPQLFSDEIRTWARSTHTDMLRLSEDCFSQALGLEGTKLAEPWIYRMMLGKIGSKLGKPMTETLQHLAKSADILRRDRAGYPSLVELTAKNHAVEAIEVHYQLHSCTLKFLLKLISNMDVSEDEKRKTEQEVLEALTQAQLPPLGTAMYDGVWEWVYEVVLEAECTKSSRCTSGQICKDAPMKKRSESQTVQVATGPTAITAEEPQMIEDMMDTSEPKVAQLVKVPNLEVERPSRAPQALVSEQHKDERPSKEDHQEAKEEEVGGEPRSPLTKSGSTSVRSSESDSPRTHDNAQSQLLQLCLYGIAVCTVRCPAYFKPLYRLSTALFKLGLPNEARMILLGPLPPALMKQQDKLQPLFVLKGMKTPIFSNMWQMNSEEINRPGNFSTHARRNLDILFQVLSRQNDSHSLLFLAQHLKNKPDTARQYMRDNERQAMFKKAVVHAMKAIKSLASDTDGMSVEEVTKLKSAASSVKSLASKVDDLKQQAKSFDEVIRALKKFITDMESTSSQDSEQGASLVATKTGGTTSALQSENTSSQSSSVGDETSGGTVMASVIVTPAISTASTFSLATTVDSKTAVPVKTVLASTVSVLVDPLPTTAAITDQPAICTYPSTMCSTATSSSDGVIPTTSMSTELPSTCSVTSVGTSVISFASAGSKTLPTDIISAKSAVGGYHDQPSTSAEACELRGDRDTLPASSHADLGMEDLVSHDHLTTAAVGQSIEEVSSMEPSRMTDRAVVSQDDVMDMEH